MKTLRYLNIEDSLGDAQLISRHLYRVGYDLIAYRVETAESLRAALESGEWDVILCDYSMPQLNALTALSLLHETGLDIPFIIISGTVGEDVAVEAMRAGAHDYLMKDNLVRLAPTIEREVQEARNRRAQRETENALRDSHAGLRALFAAIPDLILVFDIHGRFLEIGGTDPSYSRSIDSLIGKSLTDVYSNEKSDFFLENIRATLDKGEMCRVEYSLELDGKEAWFDGSISPLSKDSVIWIARDITERKLLEEQFRQSQKMEAIGRLAGGIAHDFNNLLTAIIGYSQIILSRLPKDDATGEQVKEIEKAGRFAASLTNQLLAFSRKQMLQPRVLDLNEVVLGLEKMLQRLIGEDVEMTVILNPNLRNVKADKGQIEQVIMNLAVNARDAMPQGGKLTIETDNVVLDEVYASQHANVTPGAYALLGMSDSGTGMDKETQTRIFEPFFTTKELGKGTGLGLSTVFGIVRQSGGHIWLYSELGGGTTFKVYLPLVEQPIQAIDVAAPTIEKLTGTETILLVEDEELVRTLTKEVLISKGYKVLEAQDAREAMNIYEQHNDQIHLMITDVVMPGMSGRALAEKLKLSQRGIKVLYMSGYTDNAIVHHGVLDEGTAFLQKPFTPDGLARKVREVLDTP